MNSFQMALSAVFPLFAMLALGVLLRKVKLLDVPSLNKLNTLVFKVFLSVSLYYNICTADIAKVFNGRLLAVAVGSQLVILALAVLIALPTEHGKNGEARWRMGYSTRILSFSER